MAADNAEFLPENFIQLGVPEKGFGVTTYEPPLTPEEVERYDALGLPGQWRVVMEHALDSEGRRTLSRVFYGLVNGAKNEHELVVDFTNEHSVLAFIMERELQFTPEWQARYEAARMAIGLVSLSET